MKAVYISTTGDDTTELATPLEVEGYGVGVIEMKGRVRNGFKDSFYLCKAQPHCASLSYPFHNMAAHTEATPTREGIQANAHLALARGVL